jgi:hypothetical protein
MRSNLKHLVFQLKPKHDNLSKFPKGRPEMYWAIYNSNLPRKEQEAIYEILPCRKTNVSIKAKMWTPGPLTGDWFKCSFAKLAIGEMWRRRLTIK